MIDKKKKDWFKIKKYPHIDLPLKVSDRHIWIEKYVKSKETIAEHSFSPFIHKTSKVRKFRKKYSKDDGKLIIKSINGEIKNRTSDIKKRELYYANHLDSLIFSYYSKILADKYEEKLKKNNLSEVVNAYRSVPILFSDLDGPNKSNINFANDVFNFIRTYDESEFLVIAFDIKSFFDNLNHKILLQSWMDVMEVSKLSKDHFNVFKNITRFSYVDIVDLFEEFKNKIFVQNRSRNGELLPVKRKAVSRLKFMRNQGAIAFCEKKEFLKVKNKLLKNSKTIKKDGIVKPRNFGIPQGSPISSTLANIYLYEFDKKINEHVKENGIYRRYSDDMIVVCPKSMKRSVEDLFYNSIKGFELEIQKEKTQIFHFKRNGEKLICGQEFLKKINWNKNFIYLGFEFDGKNTLIRSASLSGYYRKMKRSVLRAKNKSNQEYNKNTGEVFKRRLLRKFSYKGAQRRRKWKLDAKTGHHIKTDFYDWGNFLSYALKASKTMNNNKIKKQIKNHWKKINKILK